MPKKAAPPPVSAEVLPYLRAALRALYKKQQEDSAYYDSDDLAAAFLNQQLHRHGLAITATTPVVSKPQRSVRPNLAHSVGSPAAELKKELAEPRRIGYNQTESNRLLKGALRQAWPHVKFFVRADAYGSTDVYYLFGKAAPSLEEVEEVAKKFEGAKVNNFDGRDGVSHHRIGPDGQPEEVHYATGLLDVIAVTTKGPASWRTDRLKHISNIFPLSLRTSLKRG